MNRRVWTGTCATIVSLAAAGMLAQTTAQTPTPQQTDPSSSENKITVTGCLKAAPEMPAADATATSPTGTAGSTAAGATGTTGTASERKFVLSGASAAPADAGNAAQTYRLIANPTALMLRRD